MFNMIDHLPEFKPSHPHEDASGHEAGVDSYVNPRLSKLFQPIVRPEIVDTGDTTDDYSFLLAADEHLYESGLSDYVETSKPKEEIYRKQKQYDKLINDSTKESSARYLSGVVARDWELSNIIHESLGVSKNDSLPIVLMVDALREDPTTRYAAGNYLLNKLDNLVDIRPDDLPDRIVRNTNKVPDNGGELVDNMTSREYTTFLALAKIDGSFNADVVSSSNEVEYDTTGKVISGQHRAAADFLLNN